MYFVTITWLWFCLSEIRNHHHYTIKQTLVRNAGLSARVLFGQNVFRSAELLVPQLLSVCPKVGITIITHKHNKQTLVRNAGLSARILFVQNVVRSAELLVPQIFVSLSEIRNHYHHP